MRKYFYNFFIGMALVFLCSSVNAYAQPDQGNMEEMMKKWKIAASPNEAHKKLEWFVGNWELTMKWWMDPSAPPMESKGSAEFKMALDGRFLFQNATGSMMGMPFAGTGYIGYDNMKKCYTNFWMDNTSTGFVTAEGSIDQTGKIITWYGKMDDPTTGEYDKNVKYVARITGNNSFVYEIHDLAIGEPNTRVGEITYTRKK